MTFDRLGMETPRRHRFAQAFSRFFGWHAQGMSAAGPATVEITAVNPEVRSPETNAIIGMATDAGCVRSINEDAVAFERVTEGSRRGVLVAVCDGMGGHAAGEVASRIATQVVMREWNAVDDPADALRRAILLANRSIAAVAATNRELGGMGTTCIALILREGMAYCAHVGDSRCYLLRDGELFRMTEDHSAVMEMVKKGEISADDAREHPDKNVINRALGARFDVEVAVWPRPFRLKMGDRFLLCSDGLYDVVRDSEIRAAMVNHGPQEACERLVALAKEHGAPDNVTVTVVEMPGEKPGIAPSPEMSS